MLVITIRLMESLTIATCSFFLSPSVPMAHLIKSATILPKLFIHEAKLDEDGKIVRFEKICGQGGCLVFIEKEIWWWDHYGPTKPAWSQYHRQDRLSYHQDFSKRLQLIECFTIPLMGRKFSQFIQRNYRKIQISN